MTNIITIHSFKKGTGKSQIAANMATLMANQGQRVALVEANIQAPSARYIFELEDNAYTLNDYWLGRCTIQETLRDLSSVVSAESGQLFVFPCGDEPQDIAQLVRDGFPPKLFDEGLAMLVDELPLDTLIIDGSTGLTEKSLSTLALSSVAILVMLLDQREYQGTGATVEIVHKLQVPRVDLFVNDVPPVFDAMQVQSEVEQAYHCPVTVLPHSDEMLALGGKGVFCLQYPDHPFTIALKTASAAYSA